MIVFIFNIFLLFLFVTCFYELWMFKALGLDCSVNHCFVKDSFIFVLINT